MPFLDELFAKPVMAILRGMDPQRTVELAERAWDLGIDAVEVPIETPEAEPSLAAAVRAGTERGRPVGAGTISTSDQLRTARELGAAFTIAPGLDADVVQLSAELDLPHVPGVATPSEIQQALRLGLSWVKAFPAAELGSSWFRAMRGPFPALRVVATGGMNARNAPEFLQAGADVVAVGSALEDDAQLPALAQLIDG
ncbi:bifunctional 4-hydroxy-2-oxoglutarate aldolase/2-dehydro-3-deoxy-phosphogluconate aldolase [Saccharopolyspora mangrovi]|uniref:Bifunctional 4-hydroxy-2-oxoglutarate aldolase/2-dehydro-3-deoxy-phosphogluconate aldolase n=1 Tax=Saccharopolyspora mangrovi TaxID=3082379 RepID=A0ABU6A5T5_9PSEU|nr:bifunctional 4-hydroxy-2-oxoglutarate aldolase/2-dehydro-3-deoxy-phosphogluconate aldolase [Saccharopolyspora sp. S2-29]MEB3366898.1 bifunctional 4-hydroxy-2-oxoglutarate aldolase/2-dehydro-3-deoxy-phosphogluconate aldolase [Saccharopolyspora sp. S2-29]